MQNATNKCKMQNAKLAEDARLSADDTRKLYQIGRGDYCVVNCTTKSYFYSNADDR